MGLGTPTAFAAAAMAPALTETSQPQGFKHLINAKQACNAFDNLNTLAVTTELDKENASMADQHQQDPAEFFTEDIMQVIKSMESSASADLLFNDVDIEEPADSKMTEIRTKEMLAEVAMMQMRLEKRLAFLIRRTRRFQAKGLCQHFSQEVAGIFEMGHRAMRKKKIESGRVIYKKIDERPFTPTTMRTEGDYGKINAFVPVSTSSALVRFPLRNPIFMGSNHLIRDPLRLCENNDHLYNKREPSINKTLMSRPTDMKPKTFHIPFRRNNPHLVPNRTSSDIHLHLSTPSYSNSKGASVDMPNAVLDLRKGVKVTEGMSSIFNDVHIRSNLKKQEDTRKINMNLMESEENAKLKEPNENRHMNLIEAESPRSNLKHVEESLNLSLKLQNRDISERHLNSIVNKNLKKQNNDIDKLIEHKLLNSRVGKEVKKNEDLKKNVILLQDIVINSSNDSSQETGVKKPTGVISPCQKPLTTINQERPLNTCDEYNNKNKKPILQSSVKNLCKKFGIATAMQGNNVFRHRHTMPGRYFGSGSVVVGTQPRGSSAVTLGHFPLECKREMQRVTGHLVSEINLVQNGMDSEATSSSSGGESCDEMQPYNNPHQQYLPIYKRAAWKYATDRAAIVSRWTWLQSQIFDLEYKIKQYNELHRRIRANKGKIRMGGTSPPHNLPASPTPSTVNGYRDASPTKSSDSGIDVQCSRTRPLMHFRKRKLLSLNGLHLVSKKAARPASIRCTCSTPKEECALCTGRLDPLNPRDVPDYLSTNEMLGLLDSSYHPIFSLEDDASSSLHMEAVMGTEDWQTRCTTRSHHKAIRFPKMNRLEKMCSGEHRSSRKSEHRKKSKVRQSNGNALTAKIKHRYRGKKHARLSSLEGADEEMEGIGSANNMGFTKRTRADSYDIDNIIIPYSVAASTRVEKLQYKEILTPKWRIADHDFSAKCDSKNNGTLKPIQQNSDEDISEEALLRRHEKCEQEEKKKFLSYLKLPIGYGRSRTNRRTDSKAESSGANSPEPMSPMHTTSENPSDSPATTPPATPGLNLHRRTSSHSKQSSSTAATSASTSPAEKERCCSPPEIPEVLPYEKRTFPIPQETYDRMLKSIPEHHKVTTNARSQDSLNLIGSSPTLSEPEHDSESTESAFGDEDPNDPEWDLERVKDKYRR